MAPAPKSDNPVPAACRKLPASAVDDCIAEHNAQKASSSSDYVPQPADTQPDVQTPAAGPAGLPSPAAASLSFAMSSSSPQSPPTLSAAASSSASSTSITSTSITSTTSTTSSTSSISSISNLPSVASTTATPHSSTGYAEVYQTRTIIVPSGAASSLVPPPFAPPDNHRSTGMPHYLSAAAVLIPIIIVAVLIGAAIRYFRNKRKTKRARDGPPAMKEMSLNPPHSGDADIQPPPCTTPLMAPAITPAAVPLTNRQPQPVILSSTVDQSYFTGLDTADTSSITPISSQTSGPYTHSTDPDDPDEPPPPYRPRSVPPISREISVRTAYRPANVVSRNSSQRTYQQDPLVSNGLMGPIRHIHDMHTVRSPFDDPLNEDDVASEITTIRERTREADQVSAVSDLSYQNDTPTSLPRPGQ